MIESYREQIGDFEDQLKHYKSAQDIRKMADNLNMRLHQVNKIIEKSEIVLFEWTLQEGIPVNFVTDNIRQYGFEPEDFYDGALVDYWQFLHEDDRTEAKERVYKARQEKKKEYKHNYRVICKDGTVKWVEEWVILESNTYGDLTSELGFIRDITMQKKMTEMIEKSEQRYRTLFESAAVLMAVVDSKGCFKSVNSALVTASGYEHLTFHDSKFEDIFFPLSEEDGERWVLYDIQRNRKGNFEAGLKCRDGKVRILDNYYNVFSEDGEEHVQILSIDITDKKIVEKKFKHLSEHDKLTGLYNRMYFEDRIRQLNPSDFPIGLIMGDVNGLKVANDAFGHKVGDELLIEIARIINEQCKTGNILCRIGGDEFAIISKNADEKRIEDLVLRIKEACATSAFKPVQPSIALGYTVTPDAEVDIEELIGGADDDMYRNKIADMRVMRKGLLDALLNELMNKNAEDRGHYERMVALSDRFGRLIDLNEHQMADLIMATRLHDVGKISIQDDILEKSDPLTENEWDIVKRHSENGYHILLSIPNLGTVSELVMYHHENYDGSGYPSGLKGDDIPLLSRMIRIVDSYDVMANGTAYKGKMTHEAIVEDFRKNAGTLYDPNLMVRFLEVIH